MRSILGVLLAASIIAGHVSMAAAQRPAVQAAVERIAEDAPGDWGIAIWSLDREEWIASIDPHRPLIPASTNKIFTSAWALERLGPDYRFETDLLATGEISGGVLHGDLYLRGTGDPSFGYPDFTEQTMEPLVRMARALRERGVRTVRGTVYGDASAFGPDLMGPSWPSSTQGGSAEFAPRISGLAFQRNVIWIDLAPNGEEGSARMRLHPPVDVVPVANRARTGGGRATAARYPDRDTIIIRGGVSGRGLNRYRVGVANPVLMAADALRVALEQAGIRVEGGSGTGEAPADAGLVHRHYSVPVSAIMMKLNRESDNFFAEQLYRATAYRVGGHGGYDRASIASAMHLIENVGVNEGEIYMADGSGLSDWNRASAHAMLQTLVHASAQPWFDTFYGSLAVAGDRRGTLRRMFRGEATRDRIVAKTGFINDVRGLAGYAHAADGERIVFAFLYNGRGHNQARNAQIELGEMLVQMRGGRPASEPQDEDEEGDGGS